VTYLRPAKKRANLQIVTNALVHRVVFDGKRAVAVEFSRQSGVERVDAAREVLLSAGAIGSPDLLQLSGVGGPEVVAEALAGSSGSCPAMACSMMAQSSTVQVIGPA
jgi:choline dehydrogenase